MSVYWQPKLLICRQFLPARNESVRMREEGPETQNRLFLFSAAIQIRGSTRGFSSVSPRENQGKIKKCPMTTVLTLFI
jgi:hypothetical protein